MTRDHEWQYFGYNSCCGMSRARGHHDLCLRVLAQEIEARSGETGTGLTVGESAVRQDAPDA